MTELEQFANNLILPKSHKRRLLVETKFSKKYAMENLFLEFAVDLKIKIDEEKYPNHVFLFKNDECYFYFNLKNRRFYVEYDKIWSIFQSKFELNYIDIKSFMKYMLERHFKLMGFTPSLGSIHFTVQLERHFKLMGFTPIKNSWQISQRLERHFKLMDFTNQF